MTEPYKNPDTPLETRVEDLLSRMTLDEKIAQLHAIWLVLDEHGNHRVRADSFAGGAAHESVLDRLRDGLGQVTRPLGTRAIDPDRGLRALNQLQKFMVEETRLGIPVLSHEECLSGAMVRGATMFPSSLAFGATWNTDLIEQVGTEIGAELRAIGCRQGLAPVLDVARDARWGRTEETFGEDPYLTGLMATAYVRGLQGEKRDLLATLKHYVGHSFSEGGRNHAPVHLGWRALNDDFMLPFEMAVKLANAGSIMPAYHDIDNEPLHASRHLLTEVLRHQWGFDGIIVADYIGITLLHTHHGVAADAAEAAALAFGAGLDVELPADDCAPHLKAALARGLIDLATIDEAVRRHLREKFRVGLFEAPYANEGAVVLQSSKAVAVARTVAEQSITLLDNTGVLPLSPEARLAVIGPTADDPLALLGDYSFPVHLINTDQTDDTDQVVTPLAGLRAACPGRVRYARGCNIFDERSAGAPVFPGDVEDNTSLDIAERYSTRRDMFDAAVACAQDADVAIVCVGDLSGIFQTGTVGEGSDVDTLDLPGLQQALLDAIVATGTPVVVVLSSGRPYNLGGQEHKIAAQVMTYFSGQEGGRALADVLTGAVEPSGRLTLSVPRSAGAVPYFYNHKFKSSGTPVARHFGSRYPFGHGLSYTSFAYSDLALAADQVAIETGDVTMTFTIRNTGSRAGVAVPQLYMRDRLASVVRPVKELKAFGRVHLEPGAARKVQIALPTDMLNFTGRDGRRIVEPGMFDLMIGESSANIHLHAKVEVTGEVRHLPQNWRMVSRFETAEEAPS
ncbi:glycoside hydrolase family 3 N-terminal domain-containing protein [Tritonibacter horizontis]|uniref:Beta-D-glucoside glucohydrolase n=1 Tax=Tritonibacter horizontis TaxID=1768241 RepID=A0A132BX43_9RHOB|nr:glycoside hydrolase family 3 N-terminal domain-containing protein [Tritonibacter horizontis]KUP92959.1 periplasmic beta-glucosidase precursor [Tritonibacter horizontis]